MTNREAIENEVIQQTMYIAMYGCSKIKCKNCYLKVVCPREPLKSKEFASAIMRQKRNKDGETGK